MDEAQRSAHFKLERNSVLSYDISVVKCSVNKSVTNLSALPRDKNYKTKTLQLSNQSEELGYVVFFLLFRFFRLGLLDCLV